MQRAILTRLLKWKNNSKRKPLILRGARQVGKTTAIQLFAENFSQYIELNLELTADRSLFEQDLDIDMLTQAIFYHKNLSNNKGEVLIFIDEVQNSPKAIAMLRYFYENKPELYVICAGSLLEPLIDKEISFPVGRVEYAYLHPMTFEEFLLADPEKHHSFELLQCDSTPPEFAHQKLLTLFHRYTLIGGMPEIVSAHIEGLDLIQLEQIYGSLMTGYEDDVEKYASNKSQTKVIRHLITHAPLQAGQRIKFQNFGQSNYASREVGEAFRILEKAMLLNLVYPTTQLKLPFEANRKRSPKLQFLDTGLVNYICGLQRTTFGVQDLNNLYQGKIIEHIVGQQLLATYGESIRQPILFWVRDKVQAEAELDFVLPFGTDLIPIEVKAGKTGTLRSLHTFMSMTEYKFAIRLSANQYKEEEVRLPNGKKYRLVNLPYYLAGSWFKRNIKRILSRE